MSTTSNTAPQAASARGLQRLNPLNYVAYAGGDAANNLAFSLAMSFLAVYLTDVAQIGPAVVGLMFLLMRAVDAVTDVLMGSLIDRTSTRFGKFRPWILAGSVPLVVLAILNFAMPASLYGTAAGVAWAFIMYFLMGSVAYTSVNIPYGSLAAAMTDNRAERSRLAVARSVGSALMQIVVALAIAPAINSFRGDPAGLQNAILTALIPLGVLAIALYVFLFLTARENVQRSVDRVSLRASVATIASNRALQMLALSSVLMLVGVFGASGMMAYYARDVLGNATLIAVNQVLMSGAILVTGAFIPVLAKKLGKPRLFQVAGVVGIVAGVLLFLASQELVWLAFVGFGLFGIANSTANTLMWNMEADSVEYGEWKTGIRNEGTTYAVFSFVRKCSQALGGAVGLWILGWFGYDGTAAAQSAETIFGINVATGLLPAVSMVLAIVVMHFYPMSDAKHREILAELESRGEKPTEETSAQG